MSATAERLLVACLCAEWCTTCCQYRFGFQSLAERFRDVDFVWFDIEDHADEMGDLDVENFPTLLIAHGDDILFYGTMLPHVSHLARLLEAFSGQNRTASHDGPRPEAGRFCKENESLSALLHHVKGLRQMSRPPE